MLNPDQQFHAALRSAKSRWRAFYSMIRTYDQIDQMKEELDKCRAEIEAVKKVIDNLGKL
jgi:phosphoenolpyruvate-protein kinase (PTS system EI component)